MFKVQTQELVYFQYTLYILHTYIHHSTKCFEYKNKILRTKNLNDFIAWLLQMSQKFNVVFYRIFNVNLGLLQFFLRSLLMVITNIYGTRNTSINTLGSFSLTILKLQHSCVYNFVEMNDRLNVCALGTFIFLCLSFCVFRHIFFVIKFRLLLFFN